jgi:alkyl sulfatase BDS1-like metallo-beta-lactamase superfamily hydrolase
MQKLWIVANRVLPGVCVASEPSPAQGRQSDEIALDLVFPAQPGDWTEAQKQGFSLPREVDGLFVGAMLFWRINNKAGKELLADAYEQMGYQAESGPWRSVYLQGAYDLRNGVPSAGSINTASPDVIKAMAPEMTFDYFAVRLNGAKSAGKKLSLNIEFTDLKQPYSLVVENGVLNYFKKPFAGADAKVTLTKSTLDRIQLKEIMVEQAITSGDLKVDGKREAFTEFDGMLDAFPFWFNIVTP